MKSSASTVSILGVPFEPLSRGDAQGRVAALLQEPHNATVFTPNPEMLWQASKSPQLRELLTGADLLLPDGVGVTLAARLRGTPLPARLPGIDMAEWSLSYAATHSLSVFFLGGRPGVAQAAADRLRQRLPALTVCGTHHGYFEKDRDSAENQAVITQLRDARPDVLFVCFGFPAQERWIAENTPSLPFLRLSMGLGGSLDVWSGALRRAPAVFRKTGTEWLWRALREPRRILPLLHAPAFLATALFERMRT